MVDAPCGPDGYQPNSTVGRLGTRNLREAVWRMQSTVMIGRHSTVELAASQSSRMGASCGRC